MSVQVPLFEKGDKKASKVAAKVEEIVGEGFDVAKFVENFEVLVEAAGGVAEVRRLVLSLAVRGAFTNAECFGSEVGNSHPFRLPKGWAWQRPCRLRTGLGWSFREQIEELALCTGARVPGC
jgi:hypothetical protein